MSAASCLSTLIVIGHNFHGRNTFAAGYLEDNSIAGARSRSKDASLVALPVARKGIAPWRP